MEIFSCHILGFLVPTDHLNTTAYLSSPSIVGDQAHPLMTSVHPSSDGCRITCHVKKYKSSQTRLLNMTVNPVSSNGLSQSQILSMIEELLDEVEREICIINVESTSQQQSC